MMRTLSRPILALFVRTNWKPLLGCTLLALTCLLPSHLNAIDSDVRWCGDLWGGAFVWGIDDPYGDLHDGRTNTVTSRHYVDFTNKSDYPEVASWHAYLEVYDPVDYPKSGAHYFRRNDWGSLSAGVGESDWDYTTLSINVLQLRPREIGIYGSTRLECGDSWFAEEDFVPLYLHGH